jgi:hypothetical protein
MQRRLLQGHSSRNCWVHSSVDVVGDCTRSQLSASHDGRIIPQNPWTNLSGSPGTAILSSSHLALCQWPRNTKIHKTWQDCLETWADPMCNLHKSQDLPTSDPGSAIFPEVVDLRGHGLFMFHGINYESAPKHARTHVLDLCTTFCMAIGVLLHTNDL